MAVRGASLKTLYESAGPREFVTRVRDLVGIGRNENGQPVIANREINPREFSIRDLAESLIGPDWSDQLSRTTGNDQVTLMEADANAAIHPSAFNNVSTFKASVGGLIEATVLEAYRRPVFIGDRLARNRPTRKNGEKMPGVASMGDKALRMKPGDPHPRVQFGERYVETPELEKYGLAVDVLHETIAFDLTGQVLDEANRVGEALGMRKERRILDVFLGIVNPYKYGGTGYNTYLTAGNWINDQANPLVDWRDVDDAMQLFVNMTDQETGEPILVEGRDILVMPARLMTFQHILNATEVRKVDNQANATTIQTVGSNPIAGAGLNLMTSVLAYRRLLDADGGNLAAAAAKEYWFLGDFQGAFAYMELWAMQVKRADSNDYHMADHDIVFSIFVNEMGVPAVIEPRKILRNKDA